MGSGDEALPTPGFTVLVPAGFFRAPANFTSQQMAKNLMLDSTRGRRPGKLTPSGSLKDLLVLMHGVMPGCQTAEAPMTFT